ncbi:unnamed protein product [Boreogadus saida]
MLNILHRVKEMERYHNYYFCAVIVCEQASSSTQWPQDLSDDLYQSRAGCSPGPFRTFFRLRDLAHRVLSHLKSGCARGRSPHPHARDLTAFDLAEVDLP